MKTSPVYAPLSSAVPSQRATARIPKDEFVEGRWRALEKLAEC